MADFIELGLEAADHLIDNHFDKLPNELFQPRQALHKIRHRGGQKHPELDRIEGRPAPSASKSADEKSPANSKSPDQKMGRSKRDSEDNEGNGGYEGDEEMPTSHRKGDRSRSRRREREDPYYREAEKRTQNPRDYDPECIDNDPSSPNSPYWTAQQPSTRPPTKIPRGPSSSSLYVSHPAEPVYSTKLRSPTSPTTGVPSPSTQNYTSRSRPLSTPTPVPGYKDPYNTQRLRFPPTNSPVTRGAPSPLYDARYPDPAPNVDPYYPAQFRTPSPKPSPAPPSTSYAAAAYVPYPYPTAAAAAAAFGAERPYEYEADPASATPREQRSRSRSRSGSQHRSSHHHRHRHRYRHHRADRPGVNRRASSTGDAPSLARSRSTHRSPQQQLQRSERPTMQRRRASSTGDVSTAIDRSATNTPTPTGGRKRDFGLPSKLSSSDRGLGAGGAGALAGGFLAQEVASMLRKSGTKGGGNPMVLTLLGAMVGGLGANLIAGKEERKQEGERGSMRAWMDDVKGEGGLKAVRGWNVDDDKGNDRKDRDRDRGGRGRKGSG